MIDTKMHIFNMYINILTIPNCWAIKSFVHFSPFGAGKSGECVRHCGSQVVNEMRALRNAQQGQRCVRALRPSWWTPRRRCRQRAGRVWTLEPRLDFPFCKVGQIIAFPVLPLPTNQTLFTLFLSFLSFYSSFRTVRHWCNSQKQNWRPWVLTSKCMWALNLLSDPGLLAPRPNPCHRKTSGPP